MSTTGERFERAVQIMARLRAPGGCPWDREQTFDTIKPYTLEETYEVLEAIDNRDWPELTGELGDLLPEEIAQRLGGTIAYSKEQNGQWVAVIAVER